MALEDKTLLAERLSELPHASKKVTYRLCLECPEEFSVEGENLDLLVSLAGKLYQELAR